MRFSRPMPGLIVAGASLWLATATFADDQRSIAELRDALGKMSEPRAAVAVLGFRSVPGTDARDTWIPVGVMETLGWRLERVPNLVATPTVRLLQAREELSTGKGDKPQPPDWRKIATVVGARRILTGTCDGYASKLTLELELINVEDGQSIAKTKIGPAPLFDVLDQATRWTLEQLGVTGLSSEVERLILSPPARSPSAIEYYAKAVQAAAARQGSAMLFNLGESIGFDAGFRPALLMQAQVDARRGPNGRAAAITKLRAAQRIVQIEQDHRDDLEIELMLGRLVLSSGSLDAALERARSALNSSIARNDPYGVTSALSLMVDVTLTPTDEASANDATAERERAARALEYQNLLVELTERMGDEIALSAAVYKQALLLDQLGEADKAIAGHQRTIEIAQRAGANRIEATGWLLLGEKYQRSGRLDDSLKALNRCLELAGDKAEPKLRMTIGEVLSQQQSYDAALREFEAAYSALSVSENIDAQLTCLTRIAQTLKAKGDRQGALDRMQEAVDLAAAMRSPKATELEKALQAWRRE